MLITTTGSIEREYTVIKPQERYKYRQEAYISGRNPQTVTFTKTIVSTDDIVGGSLSVPGFYRPIDLTAAADILPFDDPMWGVMATASEIAFSDIIYEDKAADINAKANYLYMQMANTNRTGTFKNGRRIPTNIKYRILDPRSLE